jgi:hypothetical protein
MGVMDWIRGVAPPMPAEVPGKPSPMRPPERAEEVPGKTFADWKKRDEFMRPITREWRESLAFSRGDQYITYNATTWRWNVAPNPLGYPRPRLNIYDSIRRTTVSHMTRNRPASEVLPLSSTATDVESARICNDLLEGYLYDAVDLQNVLVEICTWMWHTNNVYVRPRWDPNRGDLIEEPAPVEPELMGEDGNPVEPPALMREGAIVLDVLSPFQVFPQKEARTFDEAQDLIVEHLLNPEQVKALFPDAKNLEPDTPAAEGTSYLIVQEESQQYSQGQLEYIRVLERWYLPTPKNPRGRHIVTSKNELLADEEYPFARFPIIHAQCERMPMSFHGRASAWDIKSPQKTLNSAWGHLIHHMDLAVNPPWTFSQGSVKPTDMQKRAGAIIPYDAQKGGPPSAVQMATLPQWVIDFPDRCQKLMSDMSISEVSQGRIPYSGLSGRTIAFISDLDATRLGPWAKQLAKLLGRVSVSMLELYRDNAPPEKVIRLTGGSVAEAVTFRTSDLRWGDVRVTESSLMPQPLAVKRELLMQYVQLGIMTPPQYVESMKGSAEIEDIDGKKQDRSWAKDNLALIRMGQDAFTKPWMDFPTHIAVTEEYLRSAEYRRLNPQIQQALEDYWNWLQTTAQAMQPPAPPVGPDGEQMGQDEQQEAPDDVNGGFKSLPGVNAAEEVSLGMGQGGQPMGAIPETGLDNGG